MAWYVIRTNIKCEDKAERNLREAGFGTYAPWQRFEKWNRRKNKHILHERRIVPRYLFVEVGNRAINEVPWGVIRACEGVESVLGVNGRPVPLSERSASRQGFSDIEKLQAIMEAEAQRVFDETREGKLYRREIGKTKKETTRMKFPAGTKVRINDGPFATFGGEISNVTGKGMLQVMTSIFGRLTPVELEPSQVEAIATAA
jgi:transcriptional antiterminator NusG